jgi:hypothetical protein
MDTNYTNTATSGANYSWAITPSDTEDLVRMTREVRAATAGVISWRNFAGDLQTTTVAAGESAIIRAVRIMATGTTATGLEGRA